LNKILSNYKTKELLLDHLSVVVNSYAKTAVLVDVFNGLVNEGDNNENNNDEDISSVSYFANHPCSKINKVRYITYAETLLDKLIGLVSPSSSSEYSTFITRFTNDRLSCNDSIRVIFKMLVIVKNDNHKITKDVITSLFQPAYNKTNILIKVFANMEATLTKGEVLNVLIQYPLIWKRYVLLLCQIYYFHLTRGSEEIERLIFRYESSLNDGDNNKRNLFDQSLCHFSNGDTTRDKLKYLVLSSNNFNGNNNDKNNKHNNNNNNKNGKNTSNKNNKQNNNNNDNKNDK